MASGALAAALSSPANGSYTTSKTSPRKIAFDVVKKGRAIRDFGIYCYKNANEAGAVLATHDMTVSRSGKFSYRGTARRVSNGVLAGTATLTVNGSFVTTTKAKGTAKFTANPGLSGCPGQTFVAKKTS